MKATREVQIGGRPLTVETGKVARQADGSVTVRYGDTVVLVTACANKRAREGVSFLPLTVDYREAMYAAGKIPGGFFKREGRPTEKETLSSRLIDRPLRPLFPEGWNFETQVIALVLSADKENNPDVLALTGASYALAVSNIPFTTYLAAVRVAFIDGEYVLNPTHAQLEKSSIELIVAGSEDAVVMVEAGAREASEAEMSGAIFAGHEAIRTIVADQKALARELGVEKRPFSRPPVPAEIEEIARRFFGPLGEAMKVRDKLASYVQVDAVRDEMIAALPEENSGAAPMALRVFHDMQNEILHGEVIENRVRLDGRKLDEVRAITCDVGLLPRTHGSAVFTRGETQALVTATLGTSSDIQRIDQMEIAGEKRFMLHYNFPPFSVGEVRFLRGPGRREIGHGALAERALRPLIPEAEKWPYAMRIVSDILESNGSSSMASVCGGSLALMDAGVPLRAPVAGVAMGLVMEGESYAILTDIAGAEDHYGDMDFKVTGTRKGITALQMDIKIAGITPQIMEEALAQARAGRMHILECMGEALPEPRAQISPHAPRILTIHVPKDKIREIIGPGGKMIRSIQERTGCDINIEDDGRVDIASTDETSAQRAVDIIKELTAEAELGKIYVGRVVRTVDFGAFVAILPGVEGLLHISQIAEYRVKATTDEIQEGDEVLVKVIDIDAQGRVKLSRKAAVREQQGSSEKSGSDGEHS